MEINLHNYEAFFLDYKEGNLSAELEKELFLFLEENPHLYEELHAFENIALNDFVAEDFFTDKKGLKKAEFTNENLIAYTEGVLADETKNEIETLALQNTSFKKELAFYTSTRLQVDLNEKFKNKSRLKKGGVVIALQNNFTSLRIAAALLLLVGLFFLVSNLNSNEEIKDKSLSADLRNELTVGNKQLAVISKQLSGGNKQLAVNSEKVASKNKKQASEINSSSENKNVAINAVQSNSVSVNKNSSTDSLKENDVLVKNNSAENPVTIKSYYNYHADADDETPVTVSVSSVPAKKSFFQKLVRVAKNVNEIGIKKVNASQENNSNTVSIGSFVVTETTSN